MAERATSQDTLFEGKVHCVQHLDGYRFSVDPILLAHFQRLGRGERILDLGAGCGVIGLILLYRSWQTIDCISALELQAPLVRLIEENRDRNHFGEKLVIQEGDLCEIRALYPPESFSRVVCNPPFYQKNSGRKSTNRECEIARHQVACTLAQVVRAAAYCLQNRGVFSLVYPAEGLATLVALLEGCGLRLKRMQLVYSSPASRKGAQLLLLEAVKNGGAGTVVESPFYIYQDRESAYSEEMARCYRP